VASCIGQLLSEELPDKLLPSHRSSPGWGASLHTTYSDGADPCFRRVAAYGMTLDGATSEEILKKYYKGIELTRMH
jgi:hypothetical protein